MIPKIEISTEKNRLDLSLITGFISNSYWAKGRTKDEMERLIENSLNFGVYLDEKQIGYARLVTDYGQFAYMMDVFILEKYSGKGYAKQLMEFVLNHQLLSDVKVWRLATADAHELYKKFGFKPLKNPEKLMELILG